MKRTHPLRARLVDLTSRTGIVPLARTSKAAEWNAIVLAGCYEKVWV